LALEPANSYLAFACLLTFHMQIINQRVTLASANHLQSVFCTNSTETFHAIMNDTETQKKVLDWKEGLT
jgi:hypothetical protein